MKKAMIDAGTWGMFVGKRDQLKSEGMSARDASESALKEFMPRPDVNGNLPKVEGVKRPSVGQHIKPHQEEELKAYEEEKAEKVFSDDGKEVKAPGDFEGDAEKEFYQKSLQAMQGAEVDFNVPMQTQIQWVMNSIDDPNVFQLSHAPCPSAWTLLKRCRDDSDFQSKFLLSILPKFLPRNLGESEKTEDEDNYDGRDIVDRLHEIQQIAIDSKIKEAV